MLQKSIHHRVLMGPRTFFHLRMERHPEREVTTLGLRVRFRVGTKTAVPDLAIRCFAPFFDAVSPSKIAFENFARLSKLPASVFYLGGVYLSPGPDDVCNGSDLMLSAASTSPQGDTICEEMGNNFEQGDFGQLASVLSNRRRVGTNRTCPLASLVVRSTGRGESAV